MMRPTHALFVHVRRFCSMLSGMLLAAALLATVPAAFANDVVALRRAAVQGDVQAQYNLGLAYWKGDRPGIERSYKQAADWFLKAAEQGHPGAQYYLGLAYKSGYGVGSDAQQAIDWFRKAAEQGHLAAQYNLGVLYSHPSMRNGKGVPPDFQSAKKWLGKAAAQGSVAAQAELRRVEYSERMWERWERWPSVTGLSSNTPSAPPPVQTGAVEQACVFIVSNGYNPGTGSGFFVAPGYVVTNAHVVEGARDVLVTGQAMSRPAIAQVVTTNRSGERDYAVLRLNPADCGYIRPLVFAVSTRRAERVGAWGFPGLINEADPNYHRFLQGDFSAMPTISYTEGVVSTLLERNPTMIAHTAPISPGNSGGPLVNTNGDVVGINTGGRLDDQSYHQASIALSGRDLLQFLRNNGIPAQSR